MAGPAGVRVEKLAEVPIGSVKNFGDGVEASGGGQGEIFNLLAGGDRVPLRQETQQPVGAAGQVLVDVGVPGCCERQVAVVGEAGAEHAHFTGAGDVDEVRLEAV